MSGRHHSGLMLASRITLPHFSVSSPMNLPNSLGEGWKCRRTQFGDPSLDPGITKRRVDLLVEFVDDFGRCVLRSAEATPSAGLVSAERNADGHRLRCLARAVVRVALFVIALRKRLALVDGDAARDH